MTRLLIGLRSGLFGFDTDGDDAPAQLFPCIQPLSVAIDPVEPARLYCASYDRGVWRSKDAGSTWLPIGTPQDYFASRTSSTIGPRETTFVSVSPEPEADGHHAVWVGTEPSRLYRSIDHSIDGAVSGAIDGKAGPALPPIPTAAEVPRRP